MKWINKVVVLLLYHFMKAVAITDDFTPPTLSDGCACPGEIVNYSCNLTGSLVVAIWSGTAFPCPMSSNQIALFRVTFENGLVGVDPQCGRIYTSSVSVDNSTGVLCYSSMVSVNVSTALNGKTVRCSRDDPGNVIGSPHTLSVAGAAPGTLSASAISRSTFTFNWTPTVSCSSISSYRVNANVADCGGCSHNPGTNTATCSGWTPNGQTCSVSVMSVICGGMTGEPSESLNLLLQEPSPSNVSVTLRYMYLESTGTLSSLSVSFPTVPQVQVVPDFSPDVTYSVQFNGVPQEGPEIMCSGGVCSVTFTHTPTENSENFDLAVVFSNGLGDGQASPSVRVLTDISSILSMNVRVMETTATFTLNLLEAFVGATNMRLEYRTNINEVVLNATNSSTASAGGVLTIILTSLEVGFAYNYSLFVTHDGVELELQGTFSSRCQPDDLGSSSNSTDEVCFTGDFTGGVRISGGDVCYTGTTPGGSFFAQPFCDEGYQLQSGSPQRNCQSDGMWNGTTAQCVKAESFPLWVIAVIVVGIIIFVGGGIGIVILYRCLKNKDSNDKSSSNNAEKHGRTKSSSPPPPDSLYADPNTIDHQTTATGEEYAMVDVKSKKQKPTQSAGLYQDPNAIDHQSAPSGDMYAVVDKPKRGSSKKREPDVVPPGSAGLMYADLDVSSSRNKPKPPRQQQAQHPGHVEYADISREHAEL